MTGLIGDILFLILLFAVFYFLQRHKRGKDVMARPVEYIDKRRELPDGSTEKGS